MPKFRKKPVEVEARRLPVPESADSDIREYLDQSIEIAEWCEGQSHMMLEDDEAINTVTGPHVLVPTLHGDAVARPGDWIAKGSRDCWPVDNEQFHDTYEAVDG